MFKVIAVSKSNTKLFCSYTALLRLIKGGDIQDCDLEKALFAFGCLRELVMRDRQASESEDDYSARTKIQRAVRYAEKQGRVLWRPNPPSRIVYNLLMSVGLKRFAQPDVSFQRVNRFLEFSGFKPLNLSEHDKKYYNYPRLEELVAESDQGIEVIYRAKVRFARQTPSREF
jgi:hypothetical protein